MTEQFFLMIQEIFLLFAGNIKVVVAAFVAMLFLLLLPKNKKLKQFFLYPSIVVLLIINNPLTIYWIVEKGLMSSARYVRLYWLLPITFVLAYVCVLLVKKAQGWKKYVTAILCIVIIICTGSYMFTEESYSKKTNLYNIPDDVIEICDFIEEDVRIHNQNIEEIRIIVPFYYSCYIHQYNGNIKTLYGRYSNSQIYYTIAQQMRQLIEAPELDVEEICEGAQESECNYIVIDAKKHRIGKFKKYGFEKWIQTEDYIIYKKIEGENDKKLKKKILHRIADG